MLARSLESAVRQTYPNVEIVVVDDGGPEGNREAFDRCKAKHPTIAMKFIRQKNTGLAGARNTGARNASGDFIVFLDEDDMLFPNYVSEMLAAFEQSGKEYDLAACDWINEDKHKRLTYGPAGPSIFKCPGNGRMFRRSVFYEKQLWYDDFFRRSEDFELGLRSIGKLKTMDVHIPLFKYLVPLPIFSPKQVTHLSDNMQGYFYFMKVLQKNAAVVKTLDNGARADIELHAGLFAANEGLMKEARTHLLRRLRMHFSPKILSFYLATFFGQRGFMAFRYSISRLKHRYDVWKSAPLIEKYRSVIPVDY